MPFLQSDMLLKESCINFDNFKAPALLLFSNIFFFLIISSFSLLGTDKNTKCLELVKIV